MENADKTKKQLIGELGELRLRLAQLEESEAELKSAEEALRKSEEKYRQLVQYAPSAIYELDYLNRNFISFNEVTCIYTGYSDEELTQIDPFDLFTEGSMKVFLERQELMRQGRDVPASQEYEIRKKDGTTMWALLNINYEMQDGLPRRARVVAHDISDRKTMEEILQKSEEKYRLLVSNLPGFVYTGFRDWSVEFYDNRVELLTGYDKEKFNSRKMKWIDLMVEEDLWSAKQAFIQALKTDRSYVRDYRIRSKAGDIVWIQERGHILCNKNGGIEYVSGVFYDITDLRHADENIRKSEKKYRELYEGLRDGCASVNMEGSITEFNPEFQRMLGYSQEEILKLTYRDITPVEWHPLEAKILEDQVLTRGYSDIYEKEYIKKDGTVFPVELRTYLIRNEQGNPEGMWATIRDIADRKEAQRTISESRERYRNLYRESRQREQLYESLLASTPDAVAIYNLNGEATFVNPAFTQLFGFTPEDVQGKRIPFVPGDEMEKTRAGIAKVLSGEPVSGFETKRLNKDGRTLDIALSSCCYRDHEGNPAGIVVYLRDVTGAKQIEKQLLHAQKMEAVGTLAGGIAHDFNNLLQAVLGYAQLLLLGKDKEAPGYLELQEIVRAAKRGGQLSKQLLTFSRKVESRRLPLDLNHEVKQVRELLERTIPKMIEIELHPAENLRIVEADPLQLEQVLMNLAVNAKDAMPEGGRLIIETENAVLDEEYCKVHLGAKAGDYVLLSVSDTGSGMDRKTLERIFEPFFSTKEAGRGTGLGLAMVYGIVKSHGGYIMCYSEPGAGTTFKIFLPVTGHEADTAGLEEAEVPLRGGRETILLVDDEESVLRLGEEMLSRYGYRVFKASDGESALEFYCREQERIDLVILDLIMPGMGGMKCLEELLRFDPRAKVVIASGYSADGHSKGALEAGARDFINKPYGMRQMLQVVRGILDQD
jgi:two-component system cell cycle sensor histidine kinase/response regulator CckA